jgi:hypothetical protein
MEAEAKFEVRNGIEMVPGTVHLVDCEFAVYKSLSGSLLQFGGTNNNHDALDHFSLFQFSQFMKLMLTFHSTGNYRP